MLVGTAQQELEKLAKEEDVYRENMEIERALEQERQEQMTRIAEQMRRYVVNEGMEKKKKKKDALKANYVEKKRSEDDYERKRNK